jgi:hypothetical protein
MAVTSGCTCVVERLCGRNDTNANLALSESHRVLRTVQPPHTTTSCNRASSGIYLGGGLPSIPSGGGMPSGGIPSARRYRADGLHSMPANPLCGLVR